MYDLYKEELFKHFYLARISINLSTFSFQDVFGDYKAVQLGQHSSALHSDYQKQNECNSGFSRTVISFF